MIPDRNPISPRITKALQLLEISWPLSLASLKKRYTKLARKYHPDTNGGDADLEEKFKRLMQLIPYSEHI